MSLQEKIFLLLDIELQLALCETYLLIRAYDLQQEKTFRKKITNQTLKKLSENYYNDVERLYKDFVEAAEGRSEDIHISIEQSGKLSINYDNLCGQKFQIRPHYQRHYSVRLSRRL